MHTYIQQAQQNKQLTHFLLAQTCCNDWQNMNGNITVAIMATAGSARMSVDLDLLENCPPHQSIIITNHLSSFNIHPQSYVYHHQTAINITLNIIMILNLNMATITTLLIIININNTTITIAIVRKHRRDHRRIVLHAHLVWSGRAGGDATICYLGGDLISTSY